MIQVINGKITQYELKPTGVLTTGETVSNYHMLPKKTLIEEGWLPVEEVIPDYDIETEKIAVDGYEILDDKVIKNYRVESLAPEPTELELLQQENKILKSKVDALTQQSEMLEGAIVDLAVLTLK